MCAYTYTHTFVNNFTGFLNEHVKKQYKLKKIRRKKKSKNSAGSEKKK